MITIWAVTTRQRLQENNPQPEAHTQHLAGSPGQAQPGSPDLLFRSLTLHWSAYWHRDGFLNVSMSLSLFSEDWEKNQSHLSSASLCGISVLCLKRTWALFDSFALNCPCTPTPFPPPWLPALSSELTFWGLFCIFREEQLFILF